MFEVIFHYYEATEKGKYNEDAPKTKKITVGKLEDDTLLDSVAGKIIAQFARRNILVTDVEIFEYTKKKLAFKEEDDGIRIKNKKYKFDDGAAIDGEETVGEEDLQKLAAILAANPNILSQIQGQQTSHQISQPHQALKPAKKLTVKRSEIFDPVDAALIPIAKSKGWAFTVGKQYPIYDEKLGAAVTDGMLYITTDDAGKQRIVSDKYFLPIQKQLSGSFMEDNTSVIGAGSREPQLHWDGAIDSEVPNLRGR
jgi:hypothetical protein